ncbi:uncharacterized protein (TIGR03086 family) [Herbihabitans rhizosphaerae]|uniref:Uncharacterized protein (TIGR03086 family) n=1 Tax=Herbihabitans rhizosphaerae TaxID=1872711 RepID=A0A4Q7KIV2_9PSEU|nr:TIGR03086 family metal-binding protein [Herbihabitans rhizosphaerae]RZS36469.1 uncharacterized protein (TIGR03086 family) [Herbihabitans rhizosphaerae]
MAGSMALATIGGIALLERAVNYTLGSLHLVTPDAMTRQTPCAAWDLRALLDHMNDSLLALTEAADIGYVDPVPASGIDPDEEPVAALKDRACRLIGSWTTAERDGPVLVGGCPLTAAVLTGAGAVEVAAHGWDVARACGRNRPVPPSLAEELLDLVPLLVTDADRPHRFAAPVAVPADASAGARFVAMLGRTP